MSIRTITVGCADGGHAVDLSFQVSGLTISVGSGTFRCGGTDYTLAEQTHTVTARAQEDGWVDGWLVYEIATDTPCLLVDERAAGLSGYSFPPGSPYKLLESLFTCVLPAGKTDLADAEINLFKILPVGGS